MNEVDKNAFVQASGAIYGEFSSLVPDGKALIEKALTLASE